MTTTTKNIPITDVQRVVLHAAACSSNLVAWPLPKRLKLSPGSAAIVVRGLLQKGLVEKRPVLGADAVWKEEVGKRYTLVITRAGLAACGMSAADDPAQKANDSPKRRPTAPVSDNKRPTPRAGSKLALLVQLLAREEGASVEEMVEATGWQAHTVRGVMSGALTKRFGLQIVSEKTEDRGRVYRALT
ncbi:MAG: DUF3489 domain-containing protein [Rhizobiaceae bacterium]